MGGRWLWVDKGDVDKDEAEGIERDTFAGDVDVIGYSVASFT